MTSVQAAPGSATVRALLELSDERARHLRMRIAACQESYRAGLAAGIDLGRRQALEEEAIERRIAAGLVRAATAGPTYAELERRRWVVRGEQRSRETFGQPHPQDFPGQGGAA